MQDTLLAPLAAPAAFTSTAGLTPASRGQPGSQGREAALLLDSEGCITDANTAAALLLGRHTDSLEGQDIQQLIPDLPLSPATPGYNLAYAAFHAGARDWLAHTALTVKGEYLPIELSMSCVRVHGVRVIALTLRQPSGTARWAA